MDIWWLTKNRQIHLRTSPKTKKMNQYFEKKLCIISKKPEKLIKLVIKLKNRKNYLFNEQLINLLFLFHIKFKQLFIGETTC